jgi:hypothetical protein
MNADGAKTIVLSTTPVNDNGISLKGILHTLVVFLFKREGKY